ncbi:Carbonic anhydrase [Seminavis robusta]|uniref:Carbonic anhydrase n=1 Tax=Seminavis robusta TaxID=568900 RepID=A0A9N8H698_9STRA|nr:Carbonic anhydrase [Seminavis robusta]|eukprot:Sro165_g073860.1 Carbonic anhydrase (298) ;mRNA; r:44554-45729
MFVSRFATLLIYSISWIARNVEGADPVVFDYADPDTDWPLLGFVPTPFGMEPNECGRSDRQSPINIPGSLMMSNCRSPVTPYVLDNSKESCLFSELTFPIKDIDVGVGFGNCSIPPTIKLDNGSFGNSVEYTALQFHIHTGTEHSFDGDFADAELHIVHANLAVPDFSFATGDFQVVGVKIKGEGTETHPIFEKLLVQWEAALGEIEVFCTGGHPKVGIQVRWLLRVQPTVFWNLASEVLTVSESQVTRMFAVINNYRYPEGSTAECNLNEKPSPEGWTSRPPQQLHRVVKQCGVRS